MLLPVLVFALVLRAIRPLLTPSPMLVVIQPLPDVTTAAHVRILPLPVGHVVGPLSLIHVPIPMHEAPVPMHHILYPNTLVARVVWPYLEHKIIKI